MKNGLGGCGRFCDAVEADRVSVPSQSSVLCDTCVFKQMLDGLAW